MSAFFVYFHRGRGKDFLRCVFLFQLTHFWNGIKRRFFDGLQLVTNKMPASFECKICNRSFSLKSSLKRHTTVKHKESVEQDTQTLFKCRFCEKKFVRPGLKNSHELLCNPQLSADVLNCTTIICEVCGKQYQKRYFYQHERSNFHMEKLLESVGERVSKFESAFNGRCVTYRIEPGQADEKLDSLLLFKNSKSSIIPLIESELITRKCLKLTMTLVSVYHRTTDAEIEPESGAMKHFNSKPKVISCGDDISESFEDSVSEVIASSEEFSANKSGWGLLQNLFILINILTFQLRGSQFIKLPNLLEKRRALLNIENKDSKCFLYCIAFGVFNSQIPAKESHLPYHYKHLLKLFNIEDIKFPMTIKDIGRFENRNSKFDLSISVYSFHEGNFGVLRLPKEEKSNQVDLLLLERDGDFHYCYIKDLATLIHGQFTQHNAKPLICRHCLSSFTSQEKFKTHRDIGCYDYKLETPKDPIVKFTKYYAMKRLPFIAYCDIETLCIKVDSKEEFDDREPFTEIVHIQKPFASAFKWIAFDQNENFDTVRLYNGEDCMKQFLDGLIADAELILDNYYTKIYPISTLTDEAIAYLKSKPNCFICGENLLRMKDGKVEQTVLDHNHYCPPHVAQNQKENKTDDSVTFTGNVNGIVHASCNLLYSDKKHFTIIAHNGSRFDYHLMLTSIAERGDGDLTCIAQNSETYIAFTWRLNIGKHKRVAFRFIDSIRFLPRSLASLIESMDSYPITEKFLKARLPNDLIDKSFHSKAPLCYEYFTNMKVLKETEFPPIEKFYSSLAGKTVDLEDYLRGKMLFEKLGCKSLMDYVNFYLICDVLFLADAGEQLRDMTLSKYRLDSLGYYFTLASVSLDAALLYTRKEIKLMEDVNMVLFAMKSIRGGLTVGNIEFVESNSRYSKRGVVASKGEERQILMLDVVSLYATIMLQQLVPDGDYSWLSEDEIMRLEQGISEVPNSGDVGYMLEVDLEYPISLHEAHNDWPLLPELKTMKDKSEKLVSSLYDKKNLILHFVLLKHALSQGLVLKRIHRGLKFSQSNWLHAYIQRNVDFRREEGLSNHMVQCLKDLTNNLFGKFTENLEKRRNFKLVIAKKTGNDKHLNVFSDPRVKRVVVFSENFVGLEMQKEKILLSSPIIIGASILDLSKKLMAEYVYEIQKKTSLLKDERGCFVGPNGVKICYSDTDSMILLFKGDYGYKLIQKYPEIFDTSNFEHDNRFGIIPQNRKISGKLAIEHAKSVILSFCFLRPKTYATVNENDGEDNNEIKKAKGVAKYIIKGFSAEDFHKVVTSRKSKMASMFRLASKRHEIFSVKSNKSSLSVGCTKRKFLPNGTSLALGHFRLRDADDSPFFVEK